MLQIIGIFKLFVAWHDTGIEGANDMVIEKNLINVDMDAESKAEIIQTLATQAHNCGRVINLQEYIGAVMAREKEFSTALGYLVAMPHGQSDTVTSPFVVFARTSHEVIWDENPVRLIFMIGVPMKNRDKTHMKIIAELSKKLLDDDFRAKLLTASKEKAYDLLANIDLGGM